jgi:quercetin dioxygenase-like cupin family protein
MVARHQGGQHQRRVTVRLLRQLLGRAPSSPHGRVRNYIANRHLGAEHAVIHENIIAPGVRTPWHMHAVEEVIVVPEGCGECRTDAGSDTYRVGDVLIMQPRERHALCNTGKGPLRQLCIFGGAPATTYLESEDPRHVVEVFNGP